MLGYAARTLEFAASNQQPDLEMARLDVQHMPSLIAAYNSRHPGLNASHFDTPRAFVDALAEDQRPAWRGVMRLVEGQIHHVAVDVRRHGRKRSVIVMEPAVVFSPGPTPDYLALAKTLGKKASWALIEVNAQKSLSDCLMYALHFTLLAHRGSAPRGSSQAVPGLFERWHENLARYGRLGGPEDDPARFDPVPDETLRKAGLMLHEGMDVLPSAFYKHAQSKATAMAFERRRPEIAASDVRTGRGAEPESLVDRAEAFRVQRSGGRSFSTSIEAARATKIRNALLDVGGSD
ncbi:MAG TPA: YopJ family acetyltransferase [Methylibium sp.]|nr:YopJ family acetyltransferase [Methylibium sp.]HEU4458695.1 YopJ family acetyltransferase [Methylibium sp.]